MHMHRGVRLIGFPRQSDVSKTSDQIPFYEILLGCMG